MASPSQARSSLPFAGRTDALRAFEDALVALGPDQPQVLVYHGVGGIGKSRLVRRLRRRGLDESERHFLPEDMPHAKVDFQYPENQFRNKALESVRAQLNGQGIRFPTFDIAFAAWWKLVHPSSPLSKSTFSFADESEVAAELLGLIGDVSGLGLVPKISQLVQSASKSAREWWRARGQSDLARVATASDREEVERWLPYLLAQDIRAWIAEKEGRRVALFLDTYEALPRSGASGESPDTWVEEWIREMAGVLVVISGRNEVQWSDAISQQVQHHRLRGLSEQDIESFLNRAGVSERNVRAALLQKSEGVPQYLTLAVETYRQIRETQGRPPAPEDFDANLGPLLKKFLHYVSEQERTALFVLSVPRTFDYERFRDLMDTFGGVAKTRNGLQTITRFSFVDEPELGRFALHALVREALSAEHDPEDLAAVHRHLFDQACSVLESVNPLNIGEDHRRALREGFEHGSTVLPAQNFVDWYWEIERPFYSAAELGMLSLLRKKTVSYCAEHFGPTHDETIIALSNVAAVESRLGNIEVAERLQMQLLGLLSEKKEKGSVPIYVILNNLSWTLMQRGLFAEAEGILRPALEAMTRRLGDLHEITLTARTSLGAALASQGRYQEAQSEYQFALDGYIAVGRQNSEACLTTLGSFATLMSQQGDYQSAAALLRTIVQQREHSLRPRHPDLLTSLSDLGVALLMLGKCDEADTYLRRALDGREAEFGSRHPDTFRSINHMAGVLSCQERHPEAEALYRKAQSGLRETLGANHPDTLSTSANVASALFRQRRLDEAFDELHQANARAVGSLPPDHPLTMRLGSELALLQKVRSDYDCGVTR